MYLMSETLSTDRRWPTIPTLRAPAALPMTPASSISPPAAAIGAVTAKNASPAPTVSTTVLVNAGMLITSPPLR